MNSLTNEQIEKLQKASQKLQALEDAGVDSWEGYDIALEKITQREAEESALIDTLERIMEVLAQGVYEPSERGAGWTFTDDARYEAKQIMLGKG